MPKSKRAKVVTLTKTTKRTTREKKEELVQNVIDALQEYTDLYVFDYSTCRTKYFKDARLKFRDDSKFFMTKNKILQVALEKLKDEHKNIELIGNDLQGQRGLLFTKKPKKEVLKFFKEFKMKECPRSGFVVKEKITIEKGPLEWFPHSMEQRFAKLGLPVELKNGVIYVKDDFVVCDVGQKLKPEQSKILKAFNYELAEFTMTLVSNWSNGKYTPIK